MAAPTLPPLMGGLLFSGATAALSSSLTMPIAPLTLSPVASTLPTLALPMTTPTPPTTTSAPAPAPAPMVGGILFPAAAAMVATLTANNRKATSSSSSSSTSSRKSNNKENYHRSNNNSIMNIVEGDDEEDEDEDEDGELFSELARKTDCNAMRRKIQRFLAEKTMTQTEFLRQIDANSNSFRRFMGYKQPYQGSDNSTYAGALYFFHKREKQGLKVGGRATTSAGGAKEKKGTRATQNAKAQEILDKVHSVTLEEPIHVFDDCDDIRKKINELLASKVMTQAALLRELEVNSNSMRRYLTAKGKREGCSNGVYFKAYCFFERLRIAENKPKTKKRLNAEAENPEGYSLTIDRGLYWTIAPSDMTSYW